VKKKSVSKKEKTKKMPLKQKLFCGAIYYYATTKGDNPQQACFDNANDDQFFVMYEEGKNRMYASYPNASVFFQTLSKF